MTEAEWLACSEPQPMLEFLPGKASDRKLRLFAVACCQRILALATDHRSKRAVETAGQYALGQASIHRLRRAFKAAQQAEDDAYHRPSANSDDAFVATASACAASPHRVGYIHEAYSASFAAANAVANAAHRPSRPLWDNYLANYANGVNDRLLGMQPQWVRAFAAEKRWQADLLRCIFGNPFRPTTLDRTWPNTTVTTLALVIDDECAFDRLPILADALEDAGCANQDILSHCRSGGEHVRGCWVVDLILGKE